jgi:hypothetical protein
VTTPDLRSDSSPSVLLRALNDATGLLINDIQADTLSISARNRLRDVRYIRRLVSAHIRQAEDDSGQRDSGGGPQQP